MHDIGNRHCGTAGGALNIGGEPLSVEVRLGEDSHLSSTQHTAWMLLNLLCRLTGAVREIRLRCPPEQMAIPRLSPHVKPGMTLDRALLDGVRAIGTQRDGFVRTEIAKGLSPAEIVISVGYQFDAEATFCSIGNGLCGGLFSRTIAPPTAISNSTVGPYTAACLAAGEVFRHVRLVDYEPQRQIFLSAGSYSHGSDPIWSDLDQSFELPPVILAGTGAVGTALLHALYPLNVSGKILLADNDPKGIEDTNLGRYSLFGWESIGKQKATEAARLLRDATFETVPHEGGFEYFFNQGRQIEILLSAVDTNDSRHALQERYVPLVFSASTLNLRAEILRCGPPGLGACLSCFNPLTPNQQTEDDIRKLLSSRPNLIVELTQKLNVDKSEVISWIRDRRCSKTGERLIEELRTDDGAIPAFSVGFVSVLAGTLLAAELLKVSSSHKGPLDEKRNRMVFQFHTPSAITNRTTFYPRDERCQSCSAENIGAGIWANRYQMFAARTNALPSY